MVYPRHRPGQGRGGVQADGRLRGGQDLQHDGLAGRLPHTDIGPIHTGASLLLVPFPMLLAPGFLLFALCSLLSLLPAPTDHLPTGAVEQAGAGSRLQGRGRDGEGAWAPRQLCPPGAAAPREEEDREPHRRVRPQAIRPPPPHQYQGREQQGL